MSDDLRELTDFFKDRIDELMVLEKMAEERASHLSQTARNCVASNQAEIKRFLLEMNSVPHTVKKIDGTTEKLIQYLHSCETHVKLALFLCADNCMSSINGDYVQVVPNTEGTLTHPSGKPYPGVYTQVWHKE